MEKEVIITIQSSQSVDGEPAQPAELISLGSYSYEPGRIRLSYMESELTGLEGTRTEFSVGEDEIVMDRSGTVTSRMVFNRRQKHHFLYETPYGTLSMGLDTHRIEIGLGETGGSMGIEYDLSFENVLISRNKIFVTVKEKSEKEL